MFKYAFALVVLLTSACLMPHAHAATTCDSPDLPYTIAAGTLVPTTLDVGSVIPGSAKTHTVTGSCTGKLVHHYFLLLRSECGSFRHAGRIRHQY
jgi:hypothetical protein